MWDLPEQEVSNPSASGVCSLWQNMILDINRPKLVWNHILPGLMLHQDRDSVFYLLEN